MSKYRLFFNAGASASVTVEAEAEEEAIDLAYEALPYEVCAQCGGWGQPWSIELGEWQLDDDAEAIQLVEDSTPEAAS